MIGMDSERKSGKSVVSVRLDDDDNDDLSMFSDFTHDSSNEYIFSIKIHETYSHATVMNK